MKKEYKIANLNVQIVGEKKNKYYKAMTQYFKEKEVKGAADARQDLVINVKRPGENNNFDADLFSLSGKIGFNKNAYQVKQSTYTYQVRDLFVESRPTIVTFYPNKKGNFLKTIYKVFRGANVGDHRREHEFVTSITNYSCLWYVFAMTLMKKQQVFVHCGMMSKDGKGIILGGTGGCGKTSTMMEMITHSGYQYMAEDFGVLSSDGVLFDMQKKAAIYKSDVKWKNKYLVKAVNNMPLLQRIEWMVKSDIERVNCRRHFKPTEIFGNDICERSNLSKIFVLQRTKPEEKHSCKSIESEKAANRMKDASFREIKELYEILCNIRGVGGAEYYSSYPSLSEIEKKYLSIISKGLEKVDCYNISIPLGVDPSVTAGMVLGTEK